MGFGTVGGKGKAWMSFFLRPLQNLEVGLFAIPIVLLLGEIRCLSLISSVPLTLILGVIGIFVALVSFFRSWGYGIAVIGAVFLGLTFYHHFPISIFLGRDAYCHVRSFPRSAFAEHFLCRRAY